MEEITKNNLDQLKRLRQKTKGLDVTDQTKEITDKSFDGTNGAHYRNALDNTYVDTWKDFMKNHRKYLDQAQGKVKMFPEYLKENVDSTEYYSDFNLKKFPKTINITAPNKLKYELLEDILGANSFSLIYSLTKDDKKNPYKGSAPEKMRMDVGISYKRDYETGNENKKVFVSIYGGTREWWSFTYESGNIRDINDKEIKMSPKDLNKLMTAIKHLIQ